MFDIDATSKITPNPIVAQKMIGTDAPSFSYFALEVAPEAAIVNVDSIGGLLTNVQKWLSRYWPDLVKGTKRAIS